MNISGNRKNLFLMLGVLVGMVSTGSQAFAHALPGGYYYGGYPPGGMSNQFRPGPMVPYGYGSVPFQGGPRSPRMNGNNVRRPGGANFSFNFCFGNKRR